MRMNRLLEYDDYIDDFKKTLKKRDISDDIIDDVVEWMVHPYAISDKQFIEYVLNPETTYKIYQSANKDTTPKGQIDDFLSRVDDYDRRYKSFDKELFLAWAKKVTNDFSNPQCFKSVGGKPSWMSLPISKLVKSWRSELLFNKKKSESETRRRIFKALYE